MSRNPTPITFRRGAPPPFPSRRYDRPSNYRSFRPPYQDRNPQFPPNHRPNRPAGVVNHHRPNFIVQLHSNDSTFNKAEIERLIADCKSKADSFTVHNSGKIAAILHFQQWTDTLESMVYFWEIRLDNACSVTPYLRPNVFVESDMEELDDRLKTLFSERVKVLLEGDLVKKWKKNVGKLWNEIAGITNSLTKPTPVKLHSELWEKRKGLKAERDLMEKRIGEFKCGMKCILDHLEGKLEDGGDGDVKVFRFGRHFEWGRIFKLMMRECRRLDEGLPIYAFRREILEQIYSQQVFLTTPFAYFEN